MPREFGQIAQQHVLGLRALLAFERGEGRLVEPLARGIGVLEKAEAETLECG